MAAAEALAYYQTTLAFDHLADESREKTAVTALRAFNLQWANQKCRRQKRLGSCLSCYHYDTPLASVIELGSPCFAAIPNQIPISATPTHLVSRTAAAVQRSSTSSRRERPRSSRGEDALDSFISVDSSLTSS